jgi:hypothetical protein
MSNRYLSTLGVLALFICSCASPKKRALEHLNAGSFEEAGFLYEQVLKKNPQDVEAQVGLRRARDGVLDQGLISARMARLAGNQEQASDLLLNVIQKEKSWGHTPTAKVAFTQEEEAGFAVHFIQGRVKNLNQGRKPLQAEALLFNYEPIFQDSQTVSRFDTLKNEVRQTGQNSCRQYQSENRSEGPYFADFLGRYCVHFGETCKPCAIWSKSKLRELFLQADVAGVLSNLPDDLTKILISDLKSAFEETAWYDPQGRKKAALKFKGDYTFSHDKDLTSLVHHYTEQEPYEDVEQVMKRREVPYPTDEVQYNYQTRKYESVSTVKYRTEYYPEPQRVLRYRTVNKVYPYSALKHRQKIGLNFVGNYSAINQSLDLSFQDSSVEEGYEHHLDLPKIGLKPSRPQFQDPHSWVKDRISKIRQQFKEKSQAEWAALYCRVDTSTTDQKVLSDRVQKCLRSQIKPTPSFVSDWYESQLGLSYEKAEQILSR